MVWRCMTLLTYRGLNTVKSLPSHSASRWLNTSCSPAGSGEWVTAATVADLLEPCLSASHLSFYVRLELSAVGDFPSNELRRPTTRLPQSVFRFLAQSPYLAAGRCRISAGTARDVGGSRQHCTAAQWQRVRCLYPNRSRYRVTLTWLTQRTDFSDALKCLQIGIAKSNSLVNEVIINRPIIGECLRLKCAGNNRFKSLIHFILFLLSLNVIILHVCFNVIKIAGNINNCSCRSIMINDWFLRAIILVDFFSLDLIYVAFIINGTKLNQINKQNTAI